MPGRTTAGTGRGTAASPIAPTASSSSCSSTCPLEDPVKISRLRSREPVRPDAAPHRHRVCRVGAGPLARRPPRPSSSRGSASATGALLARNAWTVDFPGRVAFLDLRGKQTAWTGDRTEILGRNGTLDHPEALERGQPLSGRVGAGPRSLRRAPADAHARPRARRPRWWCCSARASPRTEARALVERYRACRPGRGPRGGDHPLGRSPRGGPGDDAGPLAGSHAQSLAALPGAVLPRLGPRRLLPGGRAPMASGTSSRT